MKEGHDTKTYAYPKYMKENEVDLVIFTTAFPNEQNEDTKLIARKMIGLENEGWYESYPS